MGFLITPPRRLVLLQVDQQLPEAPSLRVAPELADLAFPARHGRMLSTAADVDLDCEDGFVPLARPLLDRRHGRVLRGHRRTTTHSVRSRQPDWATDAVASRASNG